MNSNLENTQMTHGYLLGTFCKQNHLAPVKQGDDVAIKLFSGGVAHRIMTIRGGAKALPGDMLSDEIVEKVKKIESALPFYSHS